MEKQVWVLLETDGDGELRALVGVFSSLEKAVEGAKKLTEERRAKYTRTWHSSWIYEEFGARKAQGFTRENVLVELEGLYEIGFWYSYPNRSERYFHVDFSAEITEIDDVMIGV